MNIFKKEMRDGFKSFLIWTIIIVGLFLVVYLVYPSMNINMDSINQMMQTFPKEILAVMNMDINNIATYFGWFKSEGLMLLLIIGSCYVGIMASNLLVKEENDKTISFLASKPVNRSKIVKTKMLSGLVYVFLFTIINYLTLFFEFNTSKGEFDIKIFNLLMLALLILYYLVFFISLAISTFFIKSKNSMGICLGFILFSYFAQMIGNMSDKLDLLKHLSIFELVSTRNIILDNALNNTYLGISVAIIIIMIVIVFYRYNQKEF